MSTRISPVGVDLVWFTGPDAVRFLNDLISQEIANLEPGQVRRSLLLSPQGKLDHILWVLRGDDQVGLITDSGRGPELAATLNRYRIRVKADIEIEERDRWVIVGGDGGEGWSGDRTGSVDADISWGDLTRTLVVGERPDLEVLTPDEYQSLRIGAGEPAWGADVDEGTIPQEAGLVEDAVDFTKGCYLGQELVARIDSRGRVVKRLRRLELDEPTEAGTPILVDGKEVGILTSVSGTTGMGMIRHEIEAGDRVKVGSTQALVSA